MKLVDTILHAGEGIAVGLRDAIHLSIFGAKPTFFIRLYDKQALRASCTATGLSNTVLRHVNNQLTRSGRTGLLFNRARTSYVDVVRKQVRQ